MASRSGRLPPCERAAVLEQLSRDKEQQYHEGDEEDTGCRVCGTDDDHANLLLCEVCNDEYHTYCLTPPLRSVPAGDFYCDKCSKPLEHDDGLEALVETTLPPEFTGRFGEIVWAAGGPGFGWWPACIYDPRLTVGMARQLARKQLGKKHLVYFFECHQAPFTVLGNNKLCLWQQGLLEEYDLGKAAKNSGKQRSVQFEHALQAAIVEHGKPVDLRLEWNHDHAAANFAVATATSTTKPNNGTKRSNSSRTTNTGKKKQKTKPSTSVVEQPPLEAIKKKRPSAMNNPEHVLYERLLAEQQESDAAAFSCQKPPAANRTNFQAALASSSSSRAINEIVEECCTQDDDDDDGELVCRLLKRIENDSNDDEETTTKLSITNVGFVTLPSRKKSAITYADLRRAIQEDNILLEDEEFRFYVPKLGPVSKRQETRLGSVLKFLQSTSDRTGRGTARHPLHVVITTATTTTVTKEEEETK